MFIKCSEYDNSKKPKIELKKLTQIILDYKNDERREADIYITKKRIGL